MRERLTSEVDRSFQSYEADIVLDHSSGPTQEKLGVNVQLCSERFSLKYNRLCVILQIVIP